MVSKAKQSKMQRNRRRQIELDTMKNGKKRSDNKSEKQNEKKGENSRFRCSKCKEYRRCSCSDRDYPCSVYMDSVRGKRGDIGER